MIKNDLTWQEIQTILNNHITIIFSKYNIQELNDYEKRRIIYDYLVRNIEYDFDKLNEISDFNLKKVQRITRNPIQELMNVILKKKGICNGISQYYKLLLECVGINCYCVVCNDGTPVNHQLNIIYNKDTNNYSFDDVTSGIVYKEYNYKYFDYDIATANAMHQGVEKNEIDEYWTVIHNELINYYIGREAGLFEDIDKFPNESIASYR